MNLALAVFIVVSVVALTVTAMLLVRRKAPAGSYFADGDRAAGVFGVIATGFAVLLGLVVFLAFDSYDTSRQGAEDEALIVGQQMDTAQRLPEAAREAVTEVLVCYARSVAGVQWDKMEDHTLHDAPNPFAVRLSLLIRTMDPQSSTEQMAYDDFVSLDRDRESARNDRIHGAVGVIPAPLWLVLFVCSATIFVFMLLFADSDERALTQAVLMGSVTIVITSLLVLLVFLDNPFHSGFGGLRPVAMERTVRLIDTHEGLADLDLRPPCDDRGVALDG